MSTILKYGVIILLLFYEILAYGQTHVFYQQISKGLNIDIIQSAIQIEPGKFIIVGKNEGFSAKVYILDFGDIRELRIDDNVDLQDATLTISSDSPMLLSKGNCYTINIEFNNLEQIDCDTIKPTQIQSLETNIILSIGSIDSLEVISHPELDQHLLFYQNKLYQFSESINQRFSYWHNNDLKAHSSLISLPVGGNQFVLSFYKPNTLYIYQDENYIDVFSLPQNEAIAKKERLYLHAVEKNGYVYFTTDDYYLIRMSLNDFALELVGQNISEFKNIFKDSKGRIWIGSKFGTIYQYNEISNSVTPRFNIARDKVNTFRTFEDSNGWIWWGFHNGLAVCIPEKNEFYIYDNEGVQDIRNNISISAIAQLGSKLFLGTYSEGVFELDYSEIERQIKRTLNSGVGIDWKSVKVERNKYFDSNNLNEIEYFNVLANVLGVRTKGAYYILDDPILKLTKETGYLSGISNFFSKKWNDKILLSLPGGFCTIDLSRKEKNSIDRSFSLLDITNKESEKLKSESIDSELVYSISLDEPFVQFRFQNHVQIDHNTNFRYRVNNERWIKTGIPEFIFSPRNSGMHKIEIQKEIDYISSSPLIIKLDVYIKWYKTIWFRVLLGLLGLFLALYFIKLYTREKRLLQNIKSLETESLRSYMNPHFISNSLNSINFYILNNKKEEASTYLVKFSKLIRSILHHTQNEFIFISQEIENLVIYLDMEKLRFKDTFSYKIEKDKSIPDDYKIPTMVLQPLLENAILHGIRPSKQHGIVELVFKKRQDGVEVIIQDNGVGISNSMASKSKEHSTRESYGSQLVKKRLILLNELYHKDYEISISDQDSGIGTIVNLKL